MRAAFIIELFISTVRLFVLGSLHFMTEWFIKGSLDFVLADALVYTVVNLKDRAVWCLRISVRVWVLQCVWDCLLDLFPFSAAVEVETCLCFFC